MAISYIGGATGTNSATLPTHAADDLIIGWGFRDGSAALPTVPSGWTTITTTTGTLCGAAIAYKIATSSGETSGTWTSANSLVIQVYRGADLTTPIGNSAILAGASTANTVQYPALTFTDTSGTSWGMVAAGHRSNAGSLNLSVAPSGYTNRTYVQDATDKAAGFDTNGGATGFAGETVTVGGGSTQGWICTSIEILEAAGGAITGTASGAVNTTGSAAGSVVITGAGAGGANITGSAAGSIVVTASASGTHTVTGAATGTIGAGAITGTAAGAVNTAGAAVGVVIVSATASGTHTVTGASAAAVTVTASASGTHTVTGTAIGTSADVRTASASGTMTISGSAAGDVDIVASGAGSHTISGAASGSVIVVASASGSHTITGASTGTVSTTRTATAAGTYTITGAATGTVATLVTRNLRLRPDGRIEAYV